MVCSHATECIGITDTGLRLTFFKKSGEKGLTTRLSIRTISHVCEPYGPQTGHRPALGDFEKRKNTTMSREFYDRLYELADMHHFDKERGEWIDLETGLPVFPKDAPKVKPLRKTLGAKA